MSKIFLLSTLEVWLRHKQPCRLSGIMILQEMLLNFDFDVDC